MLSVGGPRGCSSGGEVLRRRRCFRQGGGGVVLGMCDGWDGSVGGGASRRPWRRCWFWWLRRWAGPDLGLSGQFGCAVAASDGAGCSRLRTSVVVLEPRVGVVGVPSLWRSGGAHGDLRRFSVGFGLCYPLRVGDYGLARRLLSGWRWWFVLVLVGGREVLELFAGRKLCLGLARTDDGDACGRRILLEGVVEAGVSCSPLGFSGGNPRSLAGSGVGGALVSLCLLGPRFGCPPDKGTCGVFWWFFGGGGFVFGQAGRGLGAGVVVGAVAPVFRLRLLR